MSSQYELGLGVGILVGWVSAIFFHLYLEYMLEKMGIIPKRRQD